MTWLRPDEAAIALGVTVQHIRVIAHRKRWRKTGTGRQIGYWIDDVTDEAARRKENGHKVLDHRVM